MLLRATSFPPTRYNWNQHGPLAASFTSSSRVPVRVESVQMEPALPTAAAATASRAATNSVGFQRRGDHRQADLLPEHGGVHGDRVEVEAHARLNRASRKALSLSPIVISRSAAPK